MIEPISKISFSSQAPQVLKPLDNAQINAAAPVTAPINAMPQTNSTPLQASPRDTYKGATASAQAIGEAVSAATTTGKMLNVSTADMPNKALNTSTAFTAALKGDNVAKRQLNVVI